MPPPNTLNVQLSNLIPPPPPPPYDFAVEVVRPRDLLVLRFELINFELETGEGVEARLVRIHANRPGYMIVYFQPQSIAEHAILEKAEEFEGTGLKNDGEPLPDTPVAAQLSGPSRLVFHIPAEITEIPYTLPALLNWLPFDLSVPPNAFEKDLLVFPGAEVIQPEPSGIVITFDELFKLVVPASQMTTAQPQSSLSRSQSVSPPAVSLQATTSLFAPAQPVFRFAPFDVELLRSFAGMVEVSESDAFKIFQSVIFNPGPPQLHHTAIEFPYRLFVSPHQKAGWAHALEPVTHHNNTELWHTRLLGLKTADEFDEIAGLVRWLRAVWTHDDAKNPGPPGADFRTTLDASDRRDIVDLTSNPHLGSAVRPVMLRHFMLSALGTWMDGRGKWNPPEGYSLSEWRHRATMGRDHYVRIVREGYLFPFGHKASLVKISERKFEKTGPSEDNWWRTAYLRQRIFIIVREPEKQFPISGQTVEGRNKLPFKRVRLNTLETPNLDAPIGILNDQPEESSAFWPRVNENDFQFQIVATDLAGQDIEFTAPLIFVGGEISKNTFYLSQVEDEYLDSKNDTRREREMRGQRLAFAPSIKTGDTSFEAEKVKFGAEIVDDVLPDDQPHFFPMIDSAEARIPAVAQFLGESKAVSVTWHDPYLENGFGDENRGEVFIKLADDAEDFGLDFPVDKSGGVAKPDFKISGLSRCLGPVGGDLGTLDGGTFNPLEYFDDSAKILGDIRLKDILDLVADDLLGATPKLTTTAEGDAVVTRLNWVTNRISPFTVFKPNGTVLTLDATLRAQPGTSNETDFNIKGELTDFDIQLFDDPQFIVIHFSSFRFSSGSGKKVEFDPDISGVDFGGPLDFVSKLSSYIKPPGAGEGGPFLDVTPSGVNTGFTLAIPSIEIGIFSISNIKFAAAIFLPFTGQPVRFRFNFSERHSPAALQVYVFKGTAFFGLALGPDGVEMLEAALEFGAGVALNIFIASGKVEVMAGIYFIWEVKVNEEYAELTGYVKLYGELSVLGLITVSVTFYMGLTYNLTTRKAVGFAELIVKVEVLFFSKSVTLRVERGFAGSSGDPTFQDVLPDPAMWHAYCDAFAAYA